MHFQTKHIKSIGINEEKRLSIAVLFLEIDL